MQGFLVTLFLRSLTMSVLGFFYIGVTPLLLKRYRATWCYYAWLIIILGLVVPFRLHISGSLVEIPLPAPEMEQEAIEGFPGSLPSGQNYQNWAKTTVHLFKGFSIWEVLVVVWILGVIVFFVYQLIRHYRFLVMVRRWSDEVTDPQILSVFHDVKEQAGIHGNVDIRQSPCVYAPMLAGLIRPAVLLPAGTYAPEELAAILRHELTHLKRRDLWYRVLVVVVMGIHWFNPLLRVIAKEIAVLCELSCDDEVVENGDVDFRRQYSKTILGFAKKVGMQTTFSADLAGGCKTMTRRIATIMDTTKKKTGLTVVCTLLILAFGMGSAYTITETQVCYIDETFMKERVLSGAASGDFSTDRYIIYPEDMKAGKVPPEPAENKDAYSDKVLGAVVVELRYRYPFEMVQRDETGKKYTTRVFFDYDYALSDYIEYQELNSLIGSYLKTFEGIFKGASFEEPTKEEGIYSMINQCKEYVDNNADPRVRFRFYLSGIGDDAPGTMSPERKAS